MDKGTNTYKYSYVANFVKDQIKEGRLNVGDQIPSVHQLAKMLKVGKSTVVAGLNFLSEKGVIESVQRKGFFIKSTSIENAYRIFFLMDQLTVFKEELYSSFYEQVKEKATVDVFFHNYNAELFKKLVLENLGNYTHFVVIPNIKEDQTKILNRIPASKRIILDYKYDNLEDDYGLIYQDFQNDILEGLNSVKKNVLKYKRIVLVAPPTAFYSKFIEKGVKLFCKANQLVYERTEAIKDYKITRGDCFITLSRNDVDDVDLIKFIRAHNLTLGKQIGLLSYNHFYVKEVLEGGISVISTDFSKMGKSAASMILDGKLKKLRNDTVLKIRNSL